MMDGHLAETRSLSCPQLHGGPVSSRLFPDPLGPPAEAFVPCALCRGGWEPAKGSSIAAMTPGAWEGNTTGGRWVSALGQDIVRQLGACRLAGQAQGQQRLGRKLVGFTFIGWKGRAHPLEPVLSFPLRRPRTSPNPASVQRSVSSTPGRSVCSQVCAWNFYSSNTA